MTTAGSGEKSPGVPGVGPGDASASGLAVGVAETVIGEGDAGGAGDAVATLGLAPPAAPPTVPGGQATTALAVMSPAGSTVVEKQYVVRATSIVASSAAGIRSS